MARLLGLMLLLPLLAQPAGAQQICGAGSVGMVACIAGKLCSCGFDRGGRMSGLPAAYRWDCGVLRPGCNDEPASLPGRGPYGYGLPPGLTLDPSATNLTSRPEADWPGVDGPGVDRQGAEGPGRGARPGGREAAGRAYPP